MTAIFARVLRRSAPCPARLSPPLPSRTITAQWRHQPQPEPAVEDEVPAPEFDPLAPEWRPQPKRDCAQCHSERRVELGPDGYRCLRCGTHHAALQP